MNWNFKAKYTQYIEKLFCENFVKSLTFINKKSYNEYNSSRYLISTIIKM